MKLRDFNKIFDLAAARKGGAASLKRMLAETKPRPPRAIAKLTDDRVLAAMTRAVFAGGFGLAHHRSQMAGLRGRVQGLRPACRGLPE